LLWFVGVGAMGVIAQWLATAPRTWVGRAGVVLLVGLHLVLAIPLALLRSRSMDTANIPLELADRSLPLGAEMNGRTIILVNPPSDFLGGYVRTRRAALGEPGAPFRWLATGTTAVTLTREDARTLLVVPDRGFYPFVSEHMLRSPRRPMAVGEHVTLTGLDIEVLSLTSDGRPAAARMRFATPLEDPSLYWAAWGGHGHYVPFTPPAVGATVTLPASRFIDAAFPK
jgi:hypothetical protein